MGELPELPTRANTTTRLPLQARRGGGRVLRRDVLIVAAIVADLFLVSVIASTPASAADTTPPSTPTNLHSTSSSSSEIDIAWNASSDNVGITAYIVVRDGERRARVTAPAT